MDRHVSDASMDKDHGGEAKATPNGPRHAVDDSDEDDFVRVKEDATTERVYYQGEGLIIYKKKDDPQLYAQGSKVIFSEHPYFMLAMARIENLCVSSSLTFPTRQLASALYFAIKGKHQESKEALCDIEHHIRNVITLRGRQHYVRGALCCAIVLSGIAYGTFAYPAMHPDASTIRHIVYVLAVSSLGGILSIYIKIDKLRIEPLVPKWTNMQEGSVRMFIATIAGLFTYLCIQAGSGMVHINPQTRLGYLVVAMVAGFSETMVPSLMEKYEHPTNKPSP